MKKSIELAALAAMISTGLSGAADAGARLVERATAQRHRHRQPGNAPSGRSGTMHYPEQSDRQALRGQRRAQGGPGLFRMRDGTYVPRNQVNPA